MSISSASNLIKHRRTQHDVSATRGRSTQRKLRCRGMKIQGTSVGSPRHSRSSSPAESTRTASPSLSSTTQTGDMHEELSLNEYMSIKYATKELLERHHVYDVPSLCKFVRIEHPGVPEYVVPYVVVAAVEAASHVAHFPGVTKVYGKSDSEQHKQTSNNASISPKAWEHGARKTTLFHGPVQLSQTENVGTYVPTAMPTTANSFHFFMQSYRTNLHTYTNRDIERSNCYAQSGQCYVKRFQFVFVRLVVAAFR